MSSRLEAEETRRRSVLADIAHELRTPLSIIRGQAEAIADGIYPADPEHMAPIVSATESLEMLVDDLSTLTLAESGALRLLWNRSTSPCSSMKRSMRSAPRREPPGCSLAEHVDVNLPPLNADPGRMRGVLGNLVNNALAHARPGGTIRVDGVAADASILITVHDDGTGIPADLLPRVFDRFVEGDVVDAVRGSGSRSFVMSWRHTAGL